MNFSADHIVYLQRPDLAGELALDSLLAMGAPAGKGRIVALIDGEWDVSTGTPSEMRNAFDQHLLAELIGGVVLEADLDETVRGILNEGGVEVADKQAGCNHLHHEPKMAVGVTPKQARALAASRDVVALRAPADAQERVLLVGTRLTGRTTALFWLPTKAAIVLTITETHFPMAPLDFVADIVHLGASRYAVVDLLGFDSVDLRQRPFVERRALAAELLGELGTARLNLLDEVSRPERRSDPAGLYFVEADAPVQPFWAPRQ